MDLRKKLVESVMEYVSEDNMTSFVIDEELLGEDYPETFDIKELSGQKSYNAKKKYIGQHLKKIGSGSAREVYYVDNTKVIKLAKNNKGVAQNEIESQGFIQNYYPNAVARVYKIDDSNFWLEMELAKKISPKRFFELTGLKFNEYCNMLDYLYNINKGYRMEAPPQEMIDYYYEHEFAGEVISMMQDTGMPSGDLERISSYGEVMRDGQPAAVIVDFGLDNNVYASHYKN